MTTKSLLLALPIAALLTGCSSEEKTSEPKAIEWPELELSSLDVQVAAEQYDFGVQLFADIAQLNGQNDNGTNFAISPVSASITLTMLANSTAQSSHQAIVNLLQCKDLEAANNYTSRLLKYLPVNDPRYKLALANGVWYDKNLSLSDTYSAFMNSNFGSAPIAINFDDAKSAETINRWASDKTAGLIPTVVDNPTSLSACQLLLTNACYFESDWWSPFDEEDTLLKPFNGVSQTTEVPTMHNTFNCHYASTLTETAIKLDFVDGHASAYFILPAEGTDIYSYAASLSGSKLADIKAAMRNNLVAVQLPRFSVSSQVNFNEYLESKGVATRHIDLTPIGNSTRLQSAETIMDQFNSVTFNEKGAKAASVTVDENILTSPAADERFVANRPFVYIIEDANTGAIIMAGLTANL